MQWKRMLYINHYSSEPLILESNKNYHHRHLHDGNFEEMEFEEDNDKDIILMELVTKITAEIIVKIIILKINNRIIRFRANINFLLLYPFVICLFVMSFSISYNIRHLSSPNKY